MIAEPKTTVGRLLRAFMKTEDDWIAWNGRGIIEVLDGDEIKQFRTHIDSKFFGVYGFELLPYKV